MIQKLQTKNNTQLNLINTPYLTTPVCGYSKTNIIDILPSN